MLWSGMTRGAQLMEELVSLWSSSSRLLTYLCSRLMPIARAPKLPSSSSLQTCCRCCRLDEGRGREGSQGLTICHEQACRATEKGLSQPPHCGKSAPGLTVTGWDWEGEQ